VKHHGIYLGEDAFGIGNFLQNHFHFGKADITTATEFINGMSLILCLAAYNSLQLQEVGDFEAQNCLPPQNPASARYKASPACR